jgi:hypothetical protein
MRDDFNVKQLVDELGGFIHQFSWNLFVTLTFKARFPIPPDYLRSQWRRLITLLNREHSTDVTWVRSIEFGAEQGVPHLHALIGGTDIPPREIPRLWHPRTGNAQAETYDPEKRAAWYIAKNPEAVEFSENLLPPTTAHIEELTSASESN